jgi:hypothetical protein
MSPERDLSPRGYGRGWSEPLARGFWPRLAQRLREPATEHEYWLAIAICIAGSWWLMPLVVRLLLPG